MQPQSEIVEQLIFFAFLLLPSRTLAFKELFY
jgi:hypothetical protein